MSDPKHDPTVRVPVIGETKSLPIEGLSIRGDAIRFGPLQLGRVEGGQRVGIYTLAESDRFDVFRHVGDEHAKTTPYRVVARPDRFTFIFNPDGSPRGPDTLWLTPMVAASPDQLRHCLTLWFRDVVHMQQVPATTVWVNWIVDAVRKGVAL